jgi:hypothetical protein
MIKKAMFTVLCVALLFAVFSCGDDGPSVTTYTGKDAGGKEYKLIVTGSKYELKIDEESISTGKVTKDGNTLTLTTNGADETVKVSVTGNIITEIKGTITYDDESKKIEIDILPPFESVAGNWDWYASDDSKVNGPTVGPANVDPQTIFPPGGVSKITNAQDVTGPDGVQGQGPFIYPAGTVMDNDGKPIDATVFNFKGNTKVDPNKPSDATNGAKYGAGWPLVGWEAQPADDETLAALKTAYGYTFWVRLNSSTTTDRTTNTDDNWAYLTQVVTDFAMEKGYEYKHWFGNGNFSDGGKKMGDSGGGGAKNFTKDLEVGKWYQITVIMNKSGFNMEEDGWLFQYPPTPDPKKPFNQNAASKIQWQIPLQHNGGRQRNGDPYDQVSGSHDFDLDFYGLKLLKK